MRGFRGFRLRSHPRHRLHVRAGRLPPPGGLLAANRRPSLSLAPLLAGRRGPGPALLLAGRPRLARDALAGDPPHAVALSPLTPSRLWPTARSRRRAARRARRLLAGPLRLRPPRRPPPRPTSTARRPSKRLPSGMRLAAVRLVRPAAACLVRPAPQTSSLLWKRWRYLSRWSTRRRDSSLRPTRAASRSCTTSSTAPTCRRPVVTAARGRPWTRTPPATAWLRRAVGSCSASWSRPCLRRRGLGRAEAYGRIAALCGRRCASICPYPKSSGAALVSRTTWSALALS